MTLDQFAAWVGFLSLPATFFFFLLSVFFGCKRDAHNKVRENNEALFDTFLREEANDLTLRRDIQRNERRRQARSAMETAAVKAEYWHMASYRVRILASIAFSALPLVLLYVLLKSIFKQ